MDSGTYGWTSVILAAAGASHGLEPEWSLCEIPMDFTPGGVRHRNLQGWSVERGEVFDLVLYPRLGAVSNLSHKSFAAAVHVVFPELGPRSPCGLACALGPSSRLRSEALFCVYIETCLSLSARLP